MARKDLLKGLMGDSPKIKTGPKAPAPRMTKGAIGAVSKSIADLKSRALMDVIADQISPGGLRDRLDDDPQAHAALVESIREYGQQVPVLLRQDPNDEGRYQVVYGRRRVAALKELGQPVKAMIRNLSDRELIVAQGQENSARKDLTFIEKANFAKQMQVNGFERKVICDALHIDKTVISRMLSVADAVPEKVIYEIGSAPSIGRDRWLALSTLAGKTKEPEMLKILRGVKASSSDARFEALFAELSTPKLKPQVVKHALKSLDGQVLGAATQTMGRTTINLQEIDFADWVVGNINEIHQRFLKDRGE